MSLEKALVEAARHFFSTDRDNVTVNAVRKHVAAERGLADDYFKSDEWKEKSKQVITDEVTRLMEGDEEEEAEAEAEAEPEVKPKPAKPAKPANNKAAPKPKAKPTKLAKTKAAPKKRKLVRAVSDSEEESDLSEPSEDSFGGDDDDEEEEEEKENGAEETENSNDSDAADSPKRKKARTSKDTVIPERPAKAKAPAAAPAKSESDSPMSDVDSEKVELAPTNAAADDAAADDSDSMSSVLDDPPPKKRGKAAATAKSAKSARTKPKSEPKAKKETALSADDAEIKKLQGQLVKCGVRKIWAFELRSYGDDSKAKIHHLRGVLRSIGMDGRFSEARAREIKERRELEADLEAVQEMDKNWGVGGRASRSAARQRKSLRESTDAEDGEADEADEADASKHDAGDAGDADDDDDEPPSPKPKARSKRFNDLAFLGSDSESD